MVVAIIKDYWSLQSVKDSDLCQEVIMRILISKLMVIWCQNYLEKEIKDLSLWS